MRYTATFRDLEATAYDYGWAVSSWLDSSTKGLRWSYIIATRERYRVLVVFDHVGRVARVARSDYGSGDTIDLGGRDAGKRQRLLDWLEE
jgi:hypothetical protein